MNERTAIPFALLLLLVLSAPLPLRVEARPALKQGSALSLLHPSPYAREENLRSASQLRPERSGQTATSPVWYGFVTGGTPGTTGESGSWDFDRLPNGSPASASDPSALQGWTPWVVPYTFGASRPAPERPEWFLNYGNHGRYWQPMNMASIPNRTGGANANISGAASLWCGLDRTQAAATLGEFGIQGCAVNFPGYGDLWDQYVFRDFNCSNGVTQIVFTYKTDGDVLSEASGSAMQHGSMYDALSIWIGSAVPQVPFGSTVSNPEKDINDLLLNNANRQNLSATLSSVGGACTELDCKGYKGFNPPTVVTTAGFNIGSAVRVLFRVRTNRQRSDQSLTVSYDGSTPNQGTDYGFCVVDDVYLTNGGSANPLGSGPSGNGSPNRFTFEKNGSADFQGWQAVARTVPAWAHLQNVGDNDGTVGGLGYDVNSPNVNWADPNGVPGAPGNPCSMRNNALVTFDPTFTVLDPGIPRQHYSIGNWPLSAGENIQAVFSPNIHITGTSGQGLPAAKISLDVYAYMPLNEGVLFRFWARYKAASNGATPCPGYSPWIPLPNAYYNPDAQCFNLEVELGTSIPVATITDLELMLGTSTVCYAYGDLQASGTCVSNFSPLFDNVRFGMYTPPPDSLCGTVYADANSNFTNDGEAGLGGWTVHVTGPVSQSTVSDNQGHYCFTDLPVGTYHVTEDTQAGYLPTQPAAGSYDVGITAGATVLGIDFGNVLLRDTICGIVYLDANSNGANDAEAGLQGWTVDLNGPVHLTAQTDNMGSYCFHDVPPGTYALTEVIQSGYTLTQPSGGSYNVSVANGGAYLARDFGNSLNPDSICGTVYFDVNANATDDAEPGLDNWAVSLTGAATQTVYSDPQGHYCFHNLLPGNYQISEVTQSGYIETQPPGGTYSVAMIPGGSFPGRDFGNTLAPDTICGTVFLDLNANGVNESEAGLNGWTVNLIGPPNFATVTDAQGKYCFYNVPPGDYTVLEDLKVGYFQTGPPGGSYPVTMIPGGSFFGRDFGNNLLPDSVCGTVYLDIDHNGARAGGEPGLAGWVLSLSGASTATTTSNAVGNYCFRNIPSGNYSIVQIAKPGFLVTQPSGGTYNFTMPAGGAVLGMDFGDFTCDSVHVDSLTCVAPPAKMLAWWPLDEALPTSRNIMGSPTTAGSWIGSVSGGIPGRVGNALTFSASGSANCVSVPSTSQLQLAANDFSVDAWIRTSDPSAANRPIVGKISAVSGAGWALFLQNGKLAHKISVGGPASSSTGSGPDLRDGLWHHVAGSFRRVTNGGTLFVDGVPALTGFSVPTGSVNNTQALLIGADRNAPGYLSMRGSVDEVELFRKSLTISDVQSLFHAGPAGKCKQNVYLPTVKTFVSPQTSLNSYFTIKNQDYTSSSKTFYWTLAGLPVGAGCTVDGAATFSLPAGSVTLPAGATASVTFSVTRPPGLVSGQVACYQLSVFDGTSCMFTTAQLKASGVYKPGAPPTPAQVARNLVLAHGVPRAQEVQSGANFIPGTLPLGLFPGSVGTPSRVAFTIRNDSNSPGTVHYQLSAVPVGLDTSYNLVSLDRLPVNAVVQGTASIGAMDSAVVATGVMFDYFDSYITHEVVLSFDQNNTGSYDPVAVIGLAADSLAATDVPPGLEDNRPGVLQVHPNPFAGRITLRFMNAHRGAVEIAVFDVGGRLVRWLSRGTLDAGPQILDWDGRDGSGNVVRSGVYVIRVESSDGVAAAKAVHLRR